MHSDVSTNPDAMTVKMVPGFKRPDVLAKAQATQALRRQQRKDRVKAGFDGDGETPLPASARAGVIASAATIAQDPGADIKDRVSALNALTKLTERQDVDTSHATSELIEFLRRIPR